MTVFPISRIQRFVVASHDLPTTTNLVKKKKRKTVTENEKKIKAVRWLACERICFNEVNFKDNGNLGGEKIKCLKTFKELVKK